ncbi:MAG: riboflavin synthase [Actinobacteria bacterium]|nr:riboflavin synthase [Actinomycetota bacterium]
MFTGIIREAGKILKITKMGQEATIEISSSMLSGDSLIGDSIAVNGICLTVRDITGSSFIFDISYKTIEQTALRYARPGDIVNLEDSLTPVQKMGGHFLSGHIDAASRILEIASIDRSKKVRLEMDSCIRPFVTARCSIAIDGISLTVSETGPGYFDVVIIPHTFENTNLASKKTGDYVNVEVDMLARYVINYLENVKKPGTRETDARKDQELKEKLEKYGFI